MAVGPGQSADVEGSGDIELGDQQWVRERGILMDVKRPDSVPNP